MSTTRESKQPTKPQYIKWVNSAAKEIILADLKKGKLTLDDNELPARRAWDTLYCHQNEFSNVPFEQFEKPLRDHRKQVLTKLSRGKRKECNPTQPPKPTNIKWKTSVAREIILTDLEEGRLALYENELPAREAWDTIYCHLHEFRNVPFEQFKKQLEAHRKQALKKTKKAFNEEISFIHDRSLHPRPLANKRGEPSFDGTPAQELLREDVRNKLHEVMTPSQLQASQPEYKVYKPAIFKQRIYQEEKYQKFVFLLELKQMKKLKEREVKKAEKSVEGSNKKKAQKEDKKMMKKAVL